MSTTKPDTDTGWTGGPTKKPRPIPALTEKDTERFWSMVERGQAQDCWIWRGGFANGYAVFNLNYTTYRASRIIWFLTHDKDPSPLLACHHCDNPPCVNPGHLFIGTAKDNNDDKVWKGRESPLAAEGLRQHNEQRRAATHCKRGHPYSPENTYSPPGRPGVRRCRSCQAMAGANYEEKRERIRVNAAEYHAMVEQLIRLRAWKESAMTLLSRYDSIAETFSGKLGSSKTDNLERGVERLRKAAGDALKWFEIRDMGRQAPFIVAALREALAHTGEQS